MLVAMPAPMLKLSATRPITHGIRMAPLLATGSMMPKLVAVVIGAVIYYVVLQVILLLGLETNDLKLLTALIVAVFLAVPYWKNALPKRKTAGKEKEHA